MPQRPPAPPAGELMALLLDQSEDYALFFTTPEGVITDWYPGAAHIFGFSAGEVVGEQATRLFNSEDLERGAAEHEMAVARKARRAEDDRWHVRKDGTRFWGSGVLFGLHDPAGNLVAYAKIARNRTDVKTQTEALENQVKALSRAESQRPQRWPGQGQRVHRAPSAARRYAAIAPLSASATPRSDSFRAAWCRTRHSRTEAFGAVVHLLNPSER
jgi:PAS domain S-box-containing protein